MQKQPSGTWIRGWIWTLLLIFALALMTLSLVYILESDDLSRPHVQAFLISDQPMVVLRQKPEMSSGIAGLLPRNRWITVIEYDPDRNPGWARIEAGKEAGWVPVDRLKVDQ